MTAQNKNVIEDNEHNQRATGGCCSAREGRLRAASRSVTRSLPPRRRSTVSSAANKHSL